MQYNRLMNLISIENLSKTVNEKPLFENVTIGIDEGDKIGFIGPNGAGKSTLLHILADMAEADDGKISRNNKLKISMLEQNPKIDRGITIKDFLYKGETPVLKLLSRYHESLEGDNHTIALLDELTEKIDIENGWEVENNYISFLSELKAGSPDQTMEGLSGGMMKKAALARALAPKPNLLILDEPTNHLDIEIIEWLEKYLGSAGFSFIMVTHDRYFLDSVCTTILELDKGSVYKYPGNYTTFLERREIRFSTEKNEQERINSILRKELEWLSRGPKARASKDKKRKMRIEELIEKKTSTENREAEFSSTERRLGKKVLELKGINKSYSEKVVISPFSYKFRPGERIGIIGPNGSGKTTFLDIITGRIPVDSGEIEVGLNTSFGYYDQLSDHLTGAAERGLSVLEYIKEGAEQILNGEGISVSASRFLETFGFPVKVHRTLLKNLSGGEKRRLYLVKILTQNPNFLILDEPTNDLDLDTMRRLEDFIISFPGTIVVVSHDRAFLDRTTDFLFLFDGTGAINRFQGNYSEYREFIQQIQKDSKKEIRLNKKKYENSKKTIDPSQKGSKRKLTYRENIEFTNLEAEIDQLEKEKNSLEALFSGNTLTPEEINRNSIRYKTVTENIELKISRWEELGEISG